MKLSALLSLLPLASAATTLIPSTCFDSHCSLEQYFAYLYPWGPDHNGSARMVGNSTNHDQPPTKSHRKINYLSGAVHSARTFTVKAGSGLDIEAEFQAPTARGTWPAFWLNGAHSWPPEIDIAEWKGTGDISFNTFNTSSEVKALDVKYPSPRDFQKIKAEIRDVNGKDVSVNVYLDGKLITTQYGRGYIGKPMHLIINLQMEGSSGSSGPKTDTYYRIRNLSVVEI